MLKRKIWWISKKSSFYVLSIFWYWWCSGATTLANEPVFKNEITQNLQLAEELHKPMIKKFEKITVYSGLKDNIWGTDVADMQSINKLNNWFRFFLIFLVNILRLFLWEKKKVKHC